MQQYVIEQLINIKRLAKRGKAYNEGRGRLPDPFIAIMDEADRTLQWIESGIESRDCRYCVRDPGIAYPCIQCSQK